MFVRSISLVLVAAWLCLATAVSADGSTLAQSQPADGQPAATQPADAQPADAQPGGEPPADAQPAGPMLQPSDYAPVICDPAAAGFRYVEVRGTGFDAWDSQLLVGNVIDAAGITRERWRTVWVTPQGRLTLEVNLCSDPFQNRSALPAGNYTVSVNAGTGAPIAATSIALSPPPEAVTADEDGSVTQAPSAQASATPAATSTAVPFVLPNVVIPATPTLLPAPALAAGSTPTATPGPRTGLGSRNQPYPIGAPGMLADGWQLLVTGVTPDAWAGIKAAVPNTQAPSADQHDYVVRIQATYLGQSTGVFSSFRLGLISGINTTYDQMNNGCGIIPDMVPPNLATSGGSVRGNVCFVVRISDISTLELFDNQSTDTDRVYFALS